MNLKSVERFNDLGKALERLKEAIDTPPSHPLRTDGLIQRFEFVIELYWKVLKDMLEAVNVDVRNPSMTFKEAFYQGWLGDDDKPWVSMLEDRNLSSHTYKEKLAEEIAERIPSYYPLLERTYAALKAQMKN